MLILSQRLGLGRKGVIIAHGLSKIFCNSNIFIYSIWWHINGTIYRELSSQFTTSMPLENIRKSLVFWRFQGQCCIQDFFGRAGSLFKLVSPWDATMGDTEVNFSKIYLSRLAIIIFLEPFLYISCTPSLPSILLSSYLFSYNIALILKRQKILFRSFLVRLGENVMEFYLLFI